MSPETQTLLQWIIGIPGGALLLYLAARVITAAYFRSLRDHQNHCKGKTP